jgi:hypothetical protein
MVKATGKKDRSLLATGGGNATASGVSFQASVAAFIAAQGLAEVPIDARLALGAAKPVALRFETEAPVDDILVSLDSGGWAFIQGKYRLTNSPSLTSELGKTCDEFARLWEAATSGSGSRGWDRPLTGGTDVMVIAVGPLTSGTIKNHGPCPGHLSLRFDGDALQRSKGGARRLPKAGGGRTRGARPSYGGR